MPAEPQKQFPDPDFCRVKRTETDDCLECLSRWGWLCPHNVSLGRILYCRHDRRREILARTEAAPGA